MSAKSTVDARLAEVVSGVQLPLDNLAFTVEAYLMANGTRLDTETRYLLAGIRDCAGRVAGCVREMASQEAVAGRQVLRGQPPVHGRSLAPAIAMSESA